MKKTALYLIMACLAAQAAFGALEFPNVGATTSQSWDFDTNENPAPATTQDNPFADGTLTACIQGDVFSGNLQYADGVWSDRSLKVTIDIPNNPVANPYKLVQVEMKYQGQIMLSWIQDNQGAEFERLERTIQPTDDGWNVVIDVWQIRPNPNSETLCYGLSGLGISNAAIDFIAVHTECVPEPATLALMGMGLVLSRTLRRKHG